MANIAVFGGTGCVGQFVVEGLESFGHQVTSLGRKKRFALSNYHSVDIYDQSVLAEVCSQFDIIINATGPANIILDKIANVAISQGVPYVDVSGEAELYELLISSHPKCQSPCIIGAGFVPGFASLLALIAHSKFDRIDEFKVFVGGIEAFTPTSATDFIASIGTNNAITGCGILNGKIQRISPFNLMPSNHSPTFLALPYLSAEHQRIAKELNIKNYQSFNLVADQNMLSLGQIAPEKAVNMLVSESTALANTYGTQQFCIMDAKGKIGKKNQSLHLHSCCSNGYRLTGWMSAIAAHQASLNPDKKGIQWLSDLIDIESCLQYIEQAKLFTDWEITMASGSTDSHQNNAIQFNEMEEGEL